MQPQAPSRQGGGRDFQGELDGYQRSLQTQLDKAKEQEEYGKCASIKKLQDV